ncbi:CPBP family intramembrane glutamic endopeptidase [Mycobacterium sp. NPDC050041]|uniref:Rv0804 family intramembrane glutamic endopeptidase n=1 Tax=Mycobacterium sp. NPDC050041 TaxID=3364293 RepID=UPI003C2F0E68
MALAVILVALKGLVSPRLPARWHPLVQAAFGTALVRLTRAPLGLRPPELRSGLRHGLAVVAVVAAVVGAAAALPVVRAAMADQKVPDRPVRWLLLRIPLGTVWAEETAFRAALATLAAEGFGPDGGRLLQSAAFGLSHIADARAAGQPVPAVVVATGLAGWGFALLAERSGSLAAPMLAHLAVNEAGAVAALAVRRRGCRRRDRAVRSRCRRCRS